MTTHIVPLAAHWEPMGGSFEQALEVDDATGTPVAIRFTFGPDSDELIVMPLTPVEAFAVSEEWELEGWIDTPTYLDGDHGTLAIESGNGFLYFKIEGH